MLAALAMPAAAFADSLSAYARARAAAGRGDAMAAAEQYRLVLAASPTDAHIAADAWRQAIAAGDMTLARRAAPLAGQGEGTLPTEVALLAAADAIAAHDPAALSRALAVLGQGPFAFVVPIVAAWASFGRASDPAAALATTKEAGAIAKVVLENRALLLIASGHFDDAVPALQLLLGDEAGRLDLRYAAAELLAGQGQGEVAAKLVAGTDSQVAGFRAHLPASKPSAAFGVSRLFTRIAADLDDDRTLGLVEALTRAALVLDPSYDRARIVLAGALGRAKAYGSALATIGAVGPASPFRLPAEEIGVALLRAKGDDAGALAAAKGLAERPGASAFAAQNYGELLDELDRPREAAAAYMLARDRMGGDAGWQVWVQIATAWDRASDWRQARDAYERAIKLGPNEGLALDAFGEALVARGEQLQRAVAMLERANTLTPSDVNIAGALAWGYLRRGEAAKAIPLLEQASVAAAGNAAVAEHLGDAYWSVGRRYEARYAWRMALAVAAPAAAARIAVKLRDGAPAS